MIIQSRFSCNQWITVQDNPGHDAERGKRWTDCWSI